jgi:polyhydroxyalkanoate synthesis regulator phasin
MSINYIHLANAKSKGKRPYFFDDPAVERVLAITMAVAGELAVTHERLDTIERLLQQKGVLQREDIERYTPDDNAAEERQRWHAEYIARVLRIVQQELEALQNPETDRPLEEIAEELGRT